MRGKKRFVFLCSIALAISVGLGVQHAFTPNSRVVATAEQTAVEVKSLRAHYYHNHTFDEVGAEGKYSLVLHVCPSMTEDDVLPFDKSFGEGNFEEQIGLYSMNGEKIEEANLSVNFDTDYAIGDVVGSTGGIHLVYDNPNGLFDKRISEYVELKIPQGTTVYNAAFYKDFSLYFFNGKWMTHKPLVNYEVEIENLPTYTLGELVEVGPAKRESFSLGELGVGDNIAGTITSGLLKERSYAIEFGLKMTSETYAVAFSMNSSIGNVWAGITLVFRNTPYDGSVGTYFLDYVNPETHHDPYVIESFVPQKDVEYTVKIIVAKEKQDRGALLALDVDGNRIGEFFIVANEGYTMSEIMNDGFLCCVDSGMDSYYGNAVITNFDKNAPVITVTATDVEEGELAETYEYDVKAMDLLDGEVSYNAEIIQGELDNGRFQKNTDYTVRITATDKAGNIATKELTFSCKYDITPPVLTFGTAVESGTLNAPIGISEEELKGLLSVTAADNKSENVVLSISFPDGMFDENGKLQEGNFRVSITATDESGNKTETTVRIRATEQEEKTAPKSGCGSAITGAGLSLLALLTVGIPFRKNKKLKGEKDEKKNEQNV
ncbi:MAG: hypothetical protein J6U60_02820 [Clostridia bacterium]|nr:hypothetical protein [Clostridia bacterium]